MISPSRADSSSRLVSCCSSPPSPVSCRPSAWARPTNSSINWSSTGLRRHRLSRLELSSSVTFSLVIDASSMIGSYTERFTVPGLAGPGEGVLLSVAAVDAQQLVAGSVLAQVGDQGRSRGAHVAGDLWSAVHRVPSKVAHGRRPGQRPRHCGVGGVRCRCSSRCCRAGSRRGGRSTACRRGPPGRGLRLRGGREASLCLAATAPWMAPRVRATSSSRYAWARPMPKSAAQ